MKKRQHLKGEKNDTESLTRSDSESYNSKAGGARERRRAGTNKQKTR